MGIRNFHVKKGTFIRKIALLSCLYIVVGFTPETVHSDQLQKVFLPEADSLFQSALSDFENGRMRNSLETARAILSLPLNQRSSAASFLICRITTDSGDLDQAESLIRDFIIRFPNSRYLSQTKMLRAEIYYKKNLNYSSLKELLWVVVNGNSKTVRSRAASNFVNLFDPAIPAAMYDELHRFFDERVVDALIQIKFAQLSIQEGKRIEADVLLGQVQDSIPFTNVLNMIEELRNSLQGDISDEKFIAVLFPFYSEFSDKGKRIYTGAQAAVNQFNNEFSSNVRLKAIDTESSAAKFASLIKEIARDRSIFGIIGPVDPDLQVLAGPLAEIYKIPIILPANSESNTEEINEFLYQIKGSMVSEGAALADFAVNQLNFSSFAILSPIGLPYEHMAQSFALTVEKFGGNVLASEVYYPGTMDFNQQFRHIRKVGYDLMMEDSLNLFIRETLINSSKIAEDSLSVEYIDSVTTSFADSLTLAELDSIWMVYRDSLVSRRKSSGIRQFDTLDYPVYTYDAVFIPLVKPEDLDFIANQFAVYNINTVLLGNSAWYDHVILERVQRNIRDLYITSDYFADDLFEPWANFRDLFRQEMGISPGVDEMYGFESVLFLFDAISNAATRERFNENLKQLNSIRGSARGAFEIDGKHQKSNWMFLRYRRGIFHLYDRIPNRSG